MSCWKWFNSILKEAGIDVTDENREKIDEAVHKFIGGCCYLSVDTPRKVLFFHSSYY